MKSVELNIQGEIPKDLLRYTVVSIPTSKWAATSISSHHFNNLEYAGNFVDRTRSSLMIKLKFYSTASQKRGIWFLAPTDYRDTDFGIQAFKY